MPDGQSIRERGSRLAPNDIDAISIDISISISINADTGSNVAPSPLPSPHHHPLVLVAVSMNTYVHVRNIAACPSVCMLIVPVYVHRIRRQPQIAIDVSVA